MLHELKLSIFTSNLWNNGCQSLARIYTSLDRQIRWKKFWKSPKISFFFKKKSVLLVEALILLLVTSAKGFKARMDRLLACFVTWVQTIPQIHLWCNTCWPLDGQHGNRAFFDPRTCARFKKSLIPIDLPLAVTALDWITTPSTLHVVTSGHWLFSAPGPLRT